MNEAVLQAEHRSAIPVNLATVAADALIEELERRGGEDDAVWEFYQQIGEQAIAEREDDGMVLVDLAELEALNDLFWTAPEKAPMEVRAWLKRITGRL